MLDTHRKDKMNVWKALSKYFHATGPSVTCISDSVNPILFMKQDRSMTIHYDCGRLRSRYVYRCFFIRLHCALMGPKWEQQYISTSCYKLNLKTFRLMQAPSSQVHHIVIRLKATLSLPFKINYYIRDCTTKLRQRFNCISPSERFLDAINCTLGNAPNGVVFTN